MKEKIIIIGVVLSGFLIFNTIKESRANEAEITQRLYAQAIEEIKNGDRDHGCRVLHEAFAQFATEICTVTDIEHVECEKS